MSRVGKRPVVIPQGVECKIDGNTISMKGPKGQIAKVMPAEVSTVLIKFILQAGRQAAIRMRRLERLLRV